MRLRAAVVVVGFAVWVGCGNSGTGVTTDAQAVKSTVNNGVVTLPVSIDGTPTQPFVLDTGAPLTLLDPNKFSAVGVQPGTNTVSSLDVGSSVHIQNATVVGATPCGLMMCSTSDPAGLLGGDILSNFQISVDYHRSTVGFDDPSVPGGLGAPASTSFELDGGRAASTTGTTVTPAVPATRIAVNVVIEGTTYPFVVDTGSSPVVLAPTLYDALVADGRAQTTSNVSTVTGTKQVPETMLNQVSLAGATQTGVTAVRSPLDLGVLSAEVGHEVDGLLGGSYLSHYFLVIDYPGREITLRSNP
jgi:hypothetical protein